MINRINKPVRETQREPFTGIGNGEALGRVNTIAMLLQ